MRFERTNIPDVVILTPDIYADERGFFMESFNRREYLEVGIYEEFVQDNISSSKYGTVRGLHYQMEQTQGKLVRALVGEVYDIAVDIRASSKTFGQWVGCVLSAEQHNAIWVPPGFAHGFLALSPIAQVMYKTTDYYHPKSQRSIRWNDPALNIPWPVAEGMRILITDKDANAPVLADAEVFK